MGLHCYICHSFLCNVSQFFCHLRKVHAVLYRGMEVKCDQSHCPRIFSSFSALKNHLMKEHRDLIDDVDVCNGEMEMDESTMLNDPIAPNYTAECCDSEMHDINYMSNSVLDLPSYVMQFVMKLQSQPNVLLSDVEKTIKDFQELLTNVSNFACKILTDMCISMNLDISLPTVSHAMSQLQGVPAILDNVSSEFKRLKYLRGTSFYTEPNEVVLGNRTDSRFDARSGSTKTIVVQDTMQYVPIEKTLGILLNDETACQLIHEHAKKVSQQKKDRITEYCDTEYFQNHPFFCKYPDTLVLHLYIDGFETTNELGSHTQIHKLEGLYMVVRNFPNKYLSKLNSIFLVGLWYANDVKTYGYDALLKPVLSTLKKLETDSGIVVDVRGEPKVVRGILSLFSADNLGLHSLFGYLESFAATKFCHICECTKDTAQDFFLEKCFVLRTRESYNDSVQQAIDDPAYNPSLTGIKRGCCLNELQYFHVAENYGVDAMHDILEGVVPFELALVLESLVAAKYFSLDELNAAIQFFDYSNSDRNSKPSTLSSFTSIHLNAAEAMCLIRNLPLMIGSKIPREEPHWQLLTMLMGIMDIVFAPEITYGLTSYLSHLISDHHAHFKVLYPLKRLLPKHHFMIHYPSTMTRCGPPTAYWCMRFEGKHYFFKQLARATNCFKNICKSLAKRSQLSLASVVMNKNLFTSCVTIGPATEKQLCDIETSVSSELCLHLNLSAAESVYVLKWVKVGHHTITRQCIVLQSVSDGIPLYGMIHDIVSVAGKTYLVVDDLVSKYYDEHFHSYALQYLQSPHLSCISLESCKDSFPLNAHTVTYEGDKHVMVAKRSVVF